MWGCNKLYPFSGLDYFQHNSECVNMKVKEKVESRLMSEMRQHLVEMNRKKMLDRGLISERELAIIGK